MSQCLHYKTEDSRPLPESTFFKSLKFMYCKDRFCRIHKFVKKSLILRDYVTTGLRHDFGFFYTRKETKNKIDLLR